MYRIAFCTLPGSTVAGVLYVSQLGLPSTGWGIHLRRDSWNMTAVTQKCTACPSLAAAALEVGNHCGITVSRLKWVPTGCQPCRSYIFLAGELKLIALTKIPAFFFCFRKALTDSIACDPYPFPRSVSGTSTWDT